ncbi:oxygen-regulated protein 1 [Striga asiatica]|uniref:Oxygen-regulated protein 1 n=1 Tax=Striga asiatica TaxID=4170 RepID=A0A5A7P8E4_STRAF|nr:oxygen-regulated protein 1 [Striga asiatica]
MRRTAAPPWNHRHLPEPPQFSATRHAHHHHVRPRPGLVSAADLASVAFSLIYNCFIYRSAFTPTSPHSDLPGKPFPLLVRVLFAGGFSLLLFTIHGESYDCGLVEERGSGDGHALICTHSRRTPLVAAADGRRRRRPPAMFLMSMKDANESPNGAVDDVGISSIPKPAKKMARYRPER